jgi:hypothetical protein
MAGDYAGEISNFEFQMKNEKCGTDFEFFI